jgi:hypothetical protein
MSTPAKAAAQRCLMTTLEEWVSTGRGRQSSATAKARREASQWTRRDPSV